MLSTVREVVNHDVPDRVGGRHRLHASALWYDGKVEPHEGDPEDGAARMRLQPFRFQIGHTFLERISLKQPNPNEVHWDV